MLKKLILVPLLLVACSEAPTGPAQDDPRSGVQIQVVDHSDGVYPDTVALHVRNWDFEGTDTTRYALTLPEMTKNGSVMLEAFSFIIEYREPDQDIHLVVWTNRSTNEAHYITP